MSGRLLCDFEKPDHLLNLEEHVRTRKQQPTESVVEFFAHIEGCFLRLSRKVSQAEQIEILRRNILPKYQQPIVFSKFSTVNRLKSACKKLEDLEQRCKRAEVDNKHVRFKSSSFANLDTDYSNVEFTNYPTNRSKEAHSLANSNLYRDSYTRRRSPSPNDTRNGTNWNQYTNWRYRNNENPRTDRFSASSVSVNRSYNQESNLPNTTRTQNFRDPSPQPGPSNGQQQEKKCVKCRRIGYHERYCPNRGNFQGAARDRSPAARNTPVSEDQEN